MNNCIGKPRFLLGTTTDIISIKTFYYQPFKFNIKVIQYENNKKKIISSFLSKLILSKNIIRRQLQNILRYSKKDTYKHFIIIILNN